MVIVALVVLAAALATGPFARRAASARPPLAANIPGQPIWVRDHPPFPLRVWAVAAAVSVVLTVAAILTAPAFQVAAAFFGLAVLGLITAIFSRYASGCDEVRAAVEAYAPRIALPCAGTTFVHVGTWSPWVARTGVPWVVVARTPELFHELAGASDAPVVLGDIPASVTGVLYTDDAAANAELIARSSATHVYVGHGDELVGTPGGLSQYDLVAVAGQAEADRFAAAGAGVPADRLRVIGRPPTKVPKTGPGRDKPARRFMELVAEISR